MAEMNGSREGPRSGIVASAWPATIRVRPMPQGGAIAIEVAPTPEVGGHAHSADCKRYSAPCSTMC